MKHDLQRGNYKQNRIKIKLNLWLTAPKGAKPVNQTPETDWQMAARPENVISITLRPFYLCRVS